MTITIIGIGLIGGSLALALRGFQTHIIGVDNNEAHIKQALDLQIIDEALSYQKAVELADLVLLAIPVDAARRLLPDVLNRINTDTVVCDMGSTKQGICEAVRKHPHRSNYVASHPIAGTEHSGPKAAFPQLFNNKVTIICERERSADFALATIEKMYKILNMNIINMGAEEHDRHIAYVSHLSHISSFSLGATVLAIEKDEANIFNMAGSGFASTVRLAKSSPQMWGPILLQNKTHISNALQAYIENLQYFKQLIDDGDIEKLMQLMTEANDIRRILKGNGLE